MVGFQRTTGSGKDLLFMAFLWSECVYTWSNGHHLVCVSGLDLLALPLKWSDDRPNAKIACWGLPDCASGLAGVFWFDIEKPNLEDSSIIWQIKGCPWLWWMVNLEGYFFCAARGICLIHRGARLFGPYCRIQNNTNSWSLLLFQDSFCCFSFTSGLSYEFLELFC